MKSWQKNSGLMVWQKQSWNGTMSQEILSRDILILICVKAEKQTARGGGGGLHFIFHLPLGQKKPMIESSIHIQFLFHLLENVKS